MHYVSCGKVRVCVVCACSLCARYKKEREGEKENLKTSHKMGAGSSVVRDAALLGAGTVIGTATALLFLAHQQKVHDSSTNASAKQEPTTKKNVLPQQAPMPVQQPKWTRNTFRGPPLERPTRCLCAEAEAEAAAAAHEVGFDTAAAAVAAPATRAPAERAADRAIGTAPSPMLASREIVCAEAKWYLEQPAFASGFPAGVSVVASLPDVSETPWDLETWRTWYKAVSTLILKKLHPGQCAIFYGTLLVQPNKMVLAVQQQAYGY